jgi:hypothetical protein
MHNIPHFELRTTALTRTPLGLAGLLFTGLISIPALALPQNATLLAVSADAGISAPPRNNAPLSAQAGVNAAILSIANSQSIDLHQPVGASATVDRIAGADQADSFGNLNASGQVGLISTSDRLFDRSAELETSDVVRITNLSRQNSGAGTYLSVYADAPRITVTGHRSNTAAQDGLASLVAPGVEDSAVIMARLDRHSLATGDKWAIDLYGDQLVAFAVDGRVGENASRQGSPDDAARPNGVIVETRVALNADVAGALVAGAINTTGIVEARGIHRDGGALILVADAGDVGSGPANSFPSHASTGTGLARASLDLGNKRNTGAAANTVASVGLGTGSGAGAIAGVTLASNLGIGLPGSSPANSGGSTGSGSNAGSGTGSGSGAGNGSGSSMGAGSGAGSSAGTGSSASSGNGSGPASGSTVASGGSPAQGPNLAQISGTGFGLGNGAATAGAVTVGNGTADGLADTLIIPGAVLGLVSFGGGAGGNNNTICLTAKDHPNDVCQVPLKIAGF